MITIFVEGNPVGKARPRFSQMRTKSGQVLTRTYTPGKTSEKELEIRRAYAAAGGQIHEGYIAVRVLALYSIPKSATKSYREAAKAGMILPTKKPDVDNVLKLVLDALNGLAYKDDCQVVTASVRKKFTTDDVPGVWIRVSRITEGYDEHN